MVNGVSTGMSCDIGPIPKPISIATRFVIQIFISLEEIFCLIKLIVKKPVVPVI